MPIKKLLAESGLDPEAVAILAAAFEDAWKTLLSSQSPLAEPHVADATRERLAKHIILSWQLGQRGQEKLAVLALSSLRRE